MEPEVEKLPTGQAQELTSSFESVVEESKSEIEAQAAEQVKRGRGRPPGTGKHQRAAAAEGEKPAGDQSSKTSEPKTSAEAKASMQNLTEEAKPLLREATKVPFSIASVHFREPAFEISDKEAELPGYYLAKYLQASWPELERQDPKSFNLYAAIFAFVLLALKKLPLIVAARKNPPPAEPTPENPPAQSSQAPQGDAIPVVYRDLTPPPFGAAGARRTGF